MIRRDHDAGCDLRTLDVWPQSHTHNHGWREGQWGRQMNHFHGDRSSTTDTRGPAWRQSRQCVLKRWRNKSSDGGFRGQTLGAGALHIFLHSLQIPVKKSVKSLFFLVLAAGSNKMFSLPLISTLSFQDFLKKKTKKKHQTAGPDASPDRLLHAQSHRDIPVSMETLDNIPFMLRWQMVLIITSLFIRVVCLFTPRAGCFFFGVVFFLTHAIYISFSVVSECRLCSLKNSLPDILNSSFVDVRCLRLEDGDVRSWIRDGVFKCCYGNEWITWVWRISTSRKELI